MSVGACNRRCATCRAVVLGLVRAHLLTLAPDLRRQVAVEALALINHTERDALDEEDDMATRREAATALGQLLTTDAIGYLLDELGPAGAGVRDAILKAAAAARDVAVDEQSAETLGERARIHTGQLAKHVGQETLPSLPKRPR